MDEIGRIERRIGLHDLRVLMAVVQAGSMGKAARLLATSQPAISRSIGELEHALGVRLLDRSAQGIEPTSYGRALLKRGTAVFDELQQGIKDIRFLSDPTVGDLTIGASIAIAEGFICSVITPSVSPLSPPHLSGPRDGYGDSLSGYCSLARSILRSCMLSGRLPRTSWMWSRSCRTRTSWWRARTIPWRAGAGSAWRS